MEFQVNISDAIKSLCPSCQYIIRGNDSNINECEIEWHCPSNIRPTQEQIIKELEKLQEEWKNKKYQRDRKPEYPSITEQLDALFHAGVFPPEMAEKIQAVKDKYPKPE